MSPAAAVHRLGGVARTGDLVRSGVSRRRLAAAVHRGDLVKPRRGLYAAPGISPAAFEAMSHCGALACVSASREMGLWTLDDGAHEPVHTWVDPRHRPVRVAIDPDPDVPGCCVFHRDGAIDAPLLHRVGLVHCLVQILSCRGEDAFFAALESALRQRLLPSEDMRRLRGAVPRASRWLLDLARSDADSGLESILRLRLHRRGISLASQVDIPGVGRVDFVLGDRLIIEADGKTHDGDRHRDVIRDAVAMALGFVTLRFDSAAILHDWPLVESAIEAAIGLGLHRSPAGLTW